MRARIRELEAEVAALRERCRLDEDTLDAVDTVRRAAWVGRPGAPVYVDDVALALVVAALEEAAQIPKWEPPKDWEWC